MLSISFERHYASLTALVNNVNVGFRARRSTPHDRRDSRVVRYIYACMQLSAEPKITAGCAGVGVVCPVPHNLRVVSPRAEPARRVTYQLANRH